VNISDYGLIEDPMERLRQITPALRHHETVMKELAKVRDIALLEAQQNPSNRMIDIMEAAGFNHARLYQKLKQLGYTRRNPEHLGWKDRRRKPKPKQSSLP
jgi:hypothetical protein